MLKIYYTCIICCIFSHSEKVSNVFIVVLASDSNANIINYNIRIESKTNYSEPKSFVVNSRRLTLNV